MLDTPTLSARALDVVQTLATLSGSLAIVWAFAEKVGKPYHDWRLKRRTEIIREVLKAELAKLDELTRSETALVAQHSSLLDRQRVMFQDFDAALDIALDNRDRLDEMNDLLDEMGLASRDRRASARNVTLALEGLLDRRKARQRGAAVPDIEAIRLARVAEPAPEEHPTPAPEP